MRHVAVPKPLDVALTIPHRPVLSKKGRYGWDSGTKKTMWLRKRLPQPPPKFIEYSYYASLFYSTMGVAWGLNVPLLGFVMLALLAVYCVWRLGPRIIDVYAPATLMLGFIMTFLLLQLLIHGETIIGDVRVFVNWGLGLVILQALLLRHGFFHRFAWAAFILGLCVLPYLAVQGGTVGVERIRVDGAGLGNPNSVGMWFGFCAVYFFVASMEARSYGVRLASFMLGIGCVFMVGLTVSRGPMLAIAIATTIALRRPLKRGFFSILVLLVLSWAFYELGYFDRIIDSYVARGSEESGREILWPGALNLFLSEPLIGVGTSNAEIYMPSHHKYAGPHNGFLYIALASGVVPLVFYLAYWIHGFRGAFYAMAKRMPDAPFQIPLLVFALLEILVLDVAIFSHWTVVVLSLATRGTHVLGKAVNSK